jgi:hypothetical protein
VQAYNEAFGKAGESTVMGSGKNQDNLKYIYSNVSLYWQGQSVGIGHDFETALNVKCYLFLCGKKNFNCNVSEIFL